MQRCRRLPCASRALRRGLLNASALVQRRAHCKCAARCGTIIAKHVCLRARAGVNATSHFTQAVVSLKRLARSDARAASGGSARSFAGRLAAAVDAQNGIDMVGVVGLLEGARSSVIEARKARVLQRFLRRCVVCCGGVRPGSEAPEWSSSTCVNIAESSVGPQHGLRSALCTHYIATACLALVANVCRYLLVGAERAQWAQPYALHFLCLPRCPTRQPSSSQPSTAQVLLVHIWARAILAQQQRFRAAPHIGAARGTTQTGSLCLGQVR